MASKLMSLIDKNKEKLNDGDYINMCSILKSLKTEEEKINKKDLYKVKYLKQSVISSCMEKGLIIVSKIKTSNIIIEPDILQEIQSFKDIEMFNCIIATKSDNTKTLHKSYSCMYTICEDDQENEIYLNYRKIILLSYSKIE